MAEKTPKALPNSTDVFTGMILWNTNKQLKTQNNLKVHQKNIWQDRIFSINHFLDEIAFISKKLRTSNEHENNWKPVVSEKLTGSRK